MRRRGQELLLPTRRYGACPTRYRVTSSGSLMLKNISYTTGWLTEHVITSIGVSEFGAAVVRLHQTSSQL